MAADGLFSHHPLRTRGMRDDRRRLAATGSPVDHVAAGGAGPDLGGNLRLHAVVERIHLRAHLHFLVGEQDRAGWRDHRTRRRRRLSLGLVDGGGAARFAAGGDSLLVLCRILCVQPDRGGEGIASRRGASMGRGLPARLRLGYFAVANEKQTGKVLLSMPFSVMAGLVWG